MSTDPKDDHPTPAPGHDLGFELPAPTPVSRKRGLALVVGSAGLVLLAVVAGALPRWARRAHVEAETAGALAQAPRVEVVTAKVVTTERDLLMPGSVQPLEETVIFARATGYARRWLADLGSDVKEGDVLLELETPELDAQLEQGRAQLAEAEAGLVRAKANVEFSKTAVERYQRLTPAGVASQQELEQRQAQSNGDRANVTVAEATIAAAQANVRRLSQAKAYSRVVAPFSGRVVSRTVERGMLVNAGTTPLFKLQTLDPVRVFVSVPQDVAASVRTETSAKVTVREYPGQTFEGTVAHLAGSLDEASRTMNTEVRVPNAEHRLLAGMYVQVSLSLPTPHRLLEIPITALYSDAKGTRVAVVDAHNEVSMRKVVIERDTGTTLLLSSGLEGDERIVKLANAALGDGSKVQLLAPTVEAAK